MENMKVLNIFGWAHNVHMFVVSMINGKILRNWLGMIGIYKKWLVSASLVSYFIDKYICRLSIVPKQSSDNVMNSIKGNK